MTKSELNNLAAEAERDAEVCAQLFDDGRLPGASRVAVEQLKMNAKHVRLGVEIAKALTGANIPPSGRLR